MGKVRILGGFDLRMMEDENGSDRLVLEQLQEKGGVVEEPQVAVEEKDIHYTHSGVAPFNTLSRPE